MQEMTPTICANAKENETKQLIDQRDGKAYWVAKLKDDNCWMSQNLALDLSNITLTSADSDVSSSWTPNLTSRIWGCEGDTSDIECFDKTLAFYNPGSYVYTTPTLAKNCTNVESMARCTGYGWQEVSSYTASKDPNFYGMYGNQVASSTTYDAHFLSGNYYSWIAATANTINDSVNNSIRTATSSICPKGWRLPLSQTSNNAVSKSFYYLLREYGVESKTPSTVTGYDAHLAPLFFVMAGGVTNNKFNAGASGFYMSPHTDSTTRLADFYQDWDYGLNVTASATNPSATTGRYYGQSVRCVAR